MIVVSNASTLIGLASIGQLDLLIGLDFIGLIGVLIEAKHRGLISEVKRYLDELRSVAGFRISDRLYKRVLIDEGERLD